MKHYKLYKICDRNIYIFHNLVIHIRYLFQRSRCGHQAVDSDNRNHDNGRASQGPSNANGPARVHVGAVVPQLRIAVDAHSEHDLKRKRYILVKGFTNYCTNRHNIP